MLDFSVLNSTMSNPTLFSVIYAFLLSFVLGTVVAVVYVMTFQGLSYSRNFLHVLVLCPIVVAIAMQAIGDNVARGIGMIGAISLLRFRTSIKDPRDTFFIFASLAAGLSSGVHAYSIAVMGTICFSIAVFILSKSSFASGPQFDGLLRFNIETKAEEQRRIENIIEKTCKNFALVSIREMSQGGRLDFAYQVKLKKGFKTNDIVTEIGKMENVRGLNLTMQESIIEV
jgi:uncharacterized membrane protein YhiD involved in acid resistance